MGKNIKIKKGLDIRLNGDADKVLKQGEASEIVEISPLDFFGIKPKVLVQPGNEVLAGTPIMYDKNNPDVMITSPVSGEVVEVVRGEKRALLGIRILADKEIRYESFKAGSAEDFSVDEIKDQLCKSGAWNLIRQRPYTNVARPDKSPKALFISAFDTAPLATDVDYAIHNEEKEFAAGLSILSKLMNGNVHLTVHSDKTQSKAFKNAQGAQVHQISGPHPSGNVGVQIHHIDPLNKGELVWVINPQDVVAIGRLFSTGNYNMTRVVAVTGSQARKRRYIQTIQGASLKSILGKDNVEGEENRYISGNVLTGSNVGKDGYLRFYDTQLTIIPEGHEREFFGWIAPGFKKFSASKSFFTWTMPKRRFTLDTNNHGEERAFVVTGEYEKVFPMDIYPVHLLKAIITNDIDSQENLGIYEVAPEDFALCEFVCTSKINAQDIVHQGLQELYNDEIESEKEHHH